MPELAERLDRMIVQRGVVVLDGGLATELERRGCDIDDPLWSAKVLCERPQAIEDLHLDYLKAGADCVITASYQATFEGLAQRGYDPSEAEAIVRRSVELAQQARSRFESLGLPGRSAPLVAASVGPYGALLHDGAEYRGDYGLSVTQLADFHRNRFSVLAGSGADLVACETIPSFLEAQALLAVLGEHPAAEAWFSFSCRDGAALCDGTPIVACGRLLDPAPQVVAIGVNCTPPMYVEPLIAQLRMVTAKPIVVYPNSGEFWDATAGCWRGCGAPASFAELALCWHAAGARIIGGCCRTGPAHICALARRLKGVVNR